MSYSVLDYMRMCPYKQPKTILDSGKCNCTKMEGTCTLRRGEKCPYGESVEVSKNENINSM